MQLTRSTVVGIALVLAPTPWVQAQVKPKPDAVSTPVPTQTAVVIHPIQAKLSSRQARIHAEPNIQSRLLYLAKQPDILWIAPKPKDGWYRVEVPGYPLYGYIDEIDVIPVENESKSDTPDLEPEAPHAIARILPEHTTWFQEPWSVLLTGGVQFLSPRAYTGTILGGIAATDDRVSHLGYYIEPALWTPFKIGLGVQLGWFGLEDAVTGYNARATVVSPLLSFQLVSKSSFALEFGFGSLYLAGADFTTQVTGTTPQESKGHYGVAGWQARMVLRAAASESINGYIEAGYKRMRRTDVMTQAGYNFTWDLSTLYLGLGIGFRL